MRHFLSQFAAVATLSVRTLPARLGTSLMTLVGIAGVVAALLVVLSIAAGLEEIMQVSGTDNSIVVLRLGSENEMSSSLELETVRTISQTPGIRRDADGLLLSEEMVVVVDLRNKNTGTDAHVPLRGVALPATRVREGFEIIEGRMFEPGKHELIVGRSVWSGYEGLNVGSTKEWANVVWTVVGVFATAGSVAESEIWSDVHTLQPVYGFGSSVHSVHATLESPESFSVFRDALADDVRAAVFVERHRDFYGRQSAVLTSTLKTVGAFAGLLMGLCATFGALNTMYAAVSARAREIATLRAIGFGAGPTVFSVLCESLTIAAIGGLIGIAIAFVGFDGLESSTMNWATYTQVAFAFQVNSTLALQGLGYALAIGLLGGLFPAIRAARLPVAVALREA